MSTLAQDHNGRDLLIARDRVRQHSQSAKAHAELGIALTSKQRWDEAIIQLNEASQLSPNDATIQYNLGLAHLLRARQGGESRAAGKQDLETAMELLLEASKQNPHLPGLHLHLGWLFGELGDPASSLKEFELAVKEDPNSADAHNDYGTALSKQEQYVSAIPQYRMALILDPKLVSASLNLEAAAHRAGKEEEQLHWAKEQVTLHPTSAIAHAMLGSALVVNRRPAPGEKELRTALRLSPVLSFAHYCLGKLLFDRNDASAAEREFRTALQAHPQTVDFLNALALVLLQEKRPSEAATVLRRAITRDPNNYALHLKLARALRQLGDHNGAAREFALGAEMMKSANDLGQVQMLINSAVNNLREGRPEQAVKQLNAAIALLPDHPESNYYLAIALAESGQPQQANAAFERALAGRPESAEMHYNFGVALWQQHQANTAIRQFRDAVRLDSSYGDAHCALALSLLRSGHKVEGKAQLREAQQLGACKKRVTNESN